MKKGFIEKWEKDEEFRYKTTRFIAIVIIVGVILGIIASMEPDIPPLQRAIAKQTALVLDILGIPAESYDYWVEVHTPTLTKEERKEVEISLAKLMLEVNETETKLIGYNNFLGKAEEDALPVYIRSLQSKGISATFYPATIVTPAVTVNIIPGCSAWLGIAIITALILAYPGATKKEKLNGLVISWACLYIINIVRLVSTIAMTNWIGKWVWPILEPLLWRWGMIVVALLLWAFWLRYTKKRK
ncbi:MAG: exosortase/archaeosortase family protein [Candidatus Diapherotrites archaeon]|nr:exosortase/archaeosortase family protein [Candidatus Diapherotrites archaeon]